VLLGTNVGVGEAANVALADVVGIVVGGVGVLLDTSVIVGVGHVEVAAGVGVSGVVVPGATTTSRGRRRKRRVCTTCSVAVSTTNTANDRGLVTMSRVPSGVTARS
jgi:hypothetical protein